MLYVIITQNHGRTWTTVHNTPLVEWTPHIEERKKERMKDENKEIRSHVILYQNTRLRDFSRENTYLKIILPRRTMHFVYLELSYYLIHTVYQL